MGDDAGVRSRVSVAGVSVSVDHYVGGRRLSSPTTFENRSPSDWSTVLAEVSAGDAATADAALTAAAEAFEGWAALGPTGRAPHLRRLADLIDERVADIAAVECVDMGMRHERPPQPGHWSGGPKLPGLRRTGRAARGTGLVVQRHRQPCAATPCWSSGGNHAVERPVHAGHLEAGSRAGCRQPGGP